MEIWQLKLRFQPKRFVKEKRCHLVSSSCWCSKQNWINLFCPQTSFDFLDIPWRKVNTNVEESFEGIADTNGKARCWHHVSPLNRSRCFRHGRLEEHSKASRIPYLRFIMAFNECPFWRGLGKKHHSVFSSRCLPNKKRFDRTWLSMPKESFDARVWQFAQWACRENKSCLHWKLFLFAFFLETPTKTRREAHKPLTTKY